MFKKKILLIALTVTLGLSMSAALAEGTAGSQSDPLLTKSYVDGTYHDEVLAGPLENLSDSMMALQYKLDQTQSGVTVKAAAKNGVVHLVNGSGLVLLSGGGTFADGFGTLIDLTAGKVLSIGSAVLPGHRYLAADGTLSLISLSGPSQLALYGSTTYGGSAELSFTDVPENAWFYNDVRYAVERNLIAGYSAETFAPEEGLTIAETIKLAACMHQLYNEGSVTLQNGGSVWYQPYVDYAGERGIVDKTYADYNAKITRSEFVKLFYNAMPESEYTHKNSVVDNAIPDVKMSDANAGQIYAFYRAGILVGSETGLFNPAQNIKRSEVAAIMTRMFDPSARKSITLT